MVITIYIVNGTIKSVLLILSIIVNHTVDGCELLHQLRGGKHPIIYRLPIILLIFWWCRIAENSTVVLMILLFFHTSIG
jgi:hypothetical protein